MDILSQNLDAENIEQVEVIDLGTKDIDVFFKSDGAKITKFEKNETSEAGGTNTYKITFDDKDVVTMSIKNGQNGAQGPSGQDADIEAAEDATSAANAAAASATAAAESASQLSDQVEDLASEVDELQDDMISIKGREYSEQAVTITSSVGNINEYTWKWNLTQGTYFAFKVKKGQSISISGNASYSANYVFVKDATPSSNTVELASGCTAMMACAVNTTKVIKATENCYLYVCLVADNGKDRTPTSIKLVYEEVEGLESRVDDLETDVEYLSGLITKKDISSKATFTDGGYIDSDSANLGNVHSSSVNSYSDHIDISGAVKIEFTANYTTASSSPCACFYKSDKSVISKIDFPYGADGSTSSNHILKTISADVPQDAVYFRTTVYTDKKSSFSLKTISSDSVADQITSATTKLSSQLDEKIEDVKYSIVGGKKLIADASVLIDGKYIFLSRGEEKDSSVNSVTPFIDITGASELELEMSTTDSFVDAGLAFYDENKVYDVYREGTYKYGNVKGKGHETVTVKVPSWAKYVRTTIYTEYKSYFFMKADIDGDVGSSVKEVEKKLQKVFVGSPKLYKSQNVSSAYESLNAKTTAELYAEYDALATAHPEWFVRKADLGNVTRDTDSKVFAIRSYEFGWNKQYLIDHEPEAAEVIDWDDNGWDSSNNPRKILLVGGMHGEEKTPCWGLMLALKDILESDADWATFIKSNFIIEIVPCLNPAGWDACRRGNCNSIVLNRDAAIGQPEYEYYLSWIEDNADAFVLIDNHGTQGRYSYMPVQSKMPIKNLVCDMAAKLSSALFGENKTFYQSVKSGYEATYSPFLIAKKTGEDAWTDGRFSKVMYEEYGMQNFALETPDNLWIGEESGSGLIGNNDMRNCKITKELVINAIQMFCSIASLPK